MKKIFFIFVLLGFIFGCAIQEDDVSFTKRIFVSLCNGDQKIEDFIDWQTFKAIDVDVGKTYSSIVSEKERKDYRTAFFYNFAHSFKAAGGRIDNFFNWRLYKKEPNKSIIAADTRAGRIILFTLILKDGKRKLSEINWQ